MSVPAILIIVALAAVLAMLSLENQTPAVGKTSAIDDPVLPPPLRVRAKPLMTQVETETLGYLELLFPQVRIHAQVAMSAIVAPAEGLSSKERTWMHRRYGQKVIDFVLQDRRTGKVLVLVELDDATHDASNDRDRDKITQAVGYSTVRLSAKARPTRASVEAAVAPALA